ncbi:hypothetical protein ASD80_08910 [Devosia sp. Root635]|nr:hypothetical protein ASD80_08910 [Devosia sp. Root635]
MASGTGAGGNDVPTLDVDKVVELTSVLFAAALDQSYWQTFLTRLSTSAGMVSTHLYGYDVKTRFAPEPLYYGYDPDFMATYAEHYGQLNAWADGLARAPVGVPVTSAQCLPEEELFATSFYNEWVLPQGDVRTGAGVVLARDHSRFFVLGGNMEQRYAHYEDGWLRTLRILAPHMRHALEIGRVHFDGIAHAELGDPVVPGGGGAILAINGARQVRYANSQALELAEQGAWLRYDALGRLHFVDPYADSALQKALSGLSDGRASVSSVVRAQDRWGHGGVVRMGRLDSDKLGSIPLGLPPGSSEPYLLVALRPQVSAAALDAQLQAEFGMTVSEIAVAVMVADGLTIDEIARQRDVSLHTVRDQVKAGMHKLGVARQVGMVRAIADLRSRILG